MDNIDLSKLSEIMGQLQENPDLVNSFLSDPTTALNSLGVELDEATIKNLVSQFATKADAAEAESSEVNTNDLMAMLSSGLKEVDADKAKEALSSLNVDAEALTSTISSLFGSKDK